MAKYKATVMEVYCKVVEIEAPDAQTAEAIVQGQWDQGRFDLAHTKGCFDHVEVWAEAADTMEVAHG